MDALYWVLAALALIGNLFTADTPHAAKKPQPRDQVSGGELVVGDDLAREYSQEKLSDCLGASD